MDKDADISLAMNLEDLTLLDCYFHAAAPIEGRELERQLFVGNPEKRFSLDVRQRKNLLQATINIQFGLVDHSDERSGGDFEAMHFGLVAGVVISAPIMGEVAITPRHLSGAGEPWQYRDKTMERNMRVEAIKSVYGLATGKLVELSSMSPLGSITLPLIDSDALFEDIAKREQGESDE